jgi:hypothetical protein
MSSTRTKKDARAKSEDDVRGSTVPISSYPETTRKRKVITAKQKEVLFPPYGTHFSKKETRTQSLSPARCDEKRCGDGDSA